MSRLADKPRINLDLRGLDAADKAAVLSIFEDLAKAGDMIKSAGDRWARLEPDVRQQVIDGAPGHYREFLHRLQRIGEGTLHPQLYAAPGRAASTLGRLPIETQERFLSERISVAIVKDGTPDVIKMDVLAMDDPTRRQVFKRVDGHLEIRSVSEQRAWLNDERTRKAAARLADRSLRITRAGRWYVEKGRAYIDRDKAKNGFTRADAVQLLKDLSAE